MNNYYILIYLSRHLKDKLAGSRFDFSYSPHKDVWEGYFTNNSEQKRVVFSTNSSETAIFLDQYRSPKKNNVTTFFDSLHQNILTDVTVAEADRFMTFHFDSGASLLFRLFGNHPNVLMIRDNELKDSFKTASDSPGDEIPEPRPAGKATRQPSPDASPKRVITSLFPAFPRHLIAPITEHYDLQEADIGEITKLAETITNSMMNTPEFRVLEDGNICLIPGHLLPVPNQRTFDNANDAVRFAYYETSKERRLSTRIRSLKPKLDAAVKKSESTLKQLSNADKGLERAEEYEQYGHILMAHAHEKLKPDQSEITLSNFYDDGNEVTIPVKAELSIAENAQRYYEKSTKSIRSVEESKRRVKDIQKQYEGLQELQDSLNSVEKIYEFDEWFKEKKERLNQLGVLSKTQKQEKLPYRKTMIDNYEVWIGKNAKSNDKLTTDAHKEDVWLHARGVGGSHVVIRMNNQKDMPPKHVIRKAASLAAWNSKARGSKLAPVIVAKRKYITKPKGSAVGAVRVQREEVEMVEPRKAVS